MNDAFIVTSPEALREVYRQPSENVVLKSVDIIDAGGAALIAVSPFLVLATASANGLDCSPKGGPPGFVQVLDEKTLLLPDWSGNNRLDGLQNIIADPRVGLVFLFPGHEETYRVNGTAVVSIDPALTGRFEHEDRQPRSVIVITVSEAYIHCGRAVAFGRLWEQEAHIADLPDVWEVFRNHLAYSRAQLEAQGA